MVVLLVPALQMVLPTLPIELQLVVLIFPVVPMVACINLPWFLCLLWSMGALVVPWCWLQIVPIAVSIVLPKVLVMHSSWWNTFFASGTTGCGASSQLWSIGVLVESWCWLQVVPMAVPIVVPIVLVMHSSWWNTLISSLPAALLGAPVVSCDQWVRSIQRQDQEWSVAWHLGF